MKHSCTYSTLPQLNCFYSQYTTWAPSHCCISQNKHTSTLQTHSVSYHWLHYLISHDNMLKYNWNAPAACYEYHRWRWVLPSERMNWFATRETGHENAPWNIRPPRSAICFVWSQRRRAMSERRSIQSEGGIWGKNHQEPADQGQNHYKDLLRLLLIYYGTGLLQNALHPFFPWYHIHHY